MVRTRGSSKEHSSPLVAKKGTKRVSTAGESSNPPAKRGRPAKGSKAASSPPEKSSSPPVTKRGRGRPKKQKTIEETMDVTADEKEEFNAKTEENGDEKEQAEAKEVEMTDANNEAEEKTKQKAVDETMMVADKIEDDTEVTKQINGDSQILENAKKHRDDERAEPKEEAAPKNETNGAKEDENNAFDEVKADTGEAHEAAKAEQNKKAESISHNESVIEDSEREAEMPSSILEKGIIYFFFRGRVGIEDPQGIEDVARSYIVLRPIPLGAKLGEGPLEDSGNARLLALPKKTLPKSGRDRFLMFVEKAKSSIKDLREQFAGNEYATKTSGTSNTPAATPFAEGIYAITSTGRESHLAYYLTKPEPSSLGNIQNELGITEKGSFIVSVKNPEAPGPANATLSNPAKYPDDLQKNFRGLRWMPLEPQLLEYEHTQFLVIGEARGGFGRALEEQSADKRDNTKEKPEEEMEKLEEEDHDRVKHLKEDDPVFADLGLSSKEYHHMQTTW